jgi:hypothetical protein
VVGVTEAQGQPERAAQLFGAAAALREAIGESLPPAEQARNDQAGAALRVALGDAVFAAAWEAGRTMPLEQAIAEAISMGNRCAQPAA